MAITLPTQLNALRAAVAAHPNSNAKRGWGIRLTETPTGYDLTVRSATGVDMPSQPIATAEDADAVVQAIQEWIATI